MWTICLSLFAFTYPGMSVSAQNSNQIYDLPKVTPPSPNAASLGKYGDIPVGLYTGVPNVSIPLYTIQVGKFSLPISLSYHSQGLKVEEQSGWVGLGWTLNAGGAITRTVHGLADEGTGGYWLTPNYTDDSIANNEFLAEDFCNGLLELQPDIFYYNFGSYSGKFVMDNTSTHVAHFIPYNNFKLSQTGNLSQITITDDNGIQYVFGNIETTTDDNGGGTIAYFTSSWYLTEIITPYGNISFTYSNESTYSVQATQIDYLLTKSTETAVFRPGSYQFERTLTNNSLILSSISFPTGKINFSTSPNRKDIPSASAITGFSVYDFNNNLQKEFAFSQSYFGDTTSSVSGSTRLKLDSVTEVNLTSSAQNKSYVLTYYNPQLVPPITSMGQDQWGFYNGQSNTTLLPFIDPVEYGIYIAGQATNYGNRNLSFSNTLIGTLTQIKYPTGGTSQFIYESNDYGNIRGIPNDSLAHTQEQVAASAAISGTTNIPSTTATFTINTSQNIQINMHGAYSNPPPVENGPSITINKINANGTLTTVYQRALVNTTTVVYTTTPLDTGNYELISSVDGTAQSMTSTVTYYTLGSIPIKTIVCGGLRIRQIINTDAASGVSNVKTYHYVTAADSTRSSGSLVNIPQLTEYETSSSFATSYLVRTATSCNYLGYTQGSIVGYATVTEMDSAAAGNGKTVSSFIGPADYANNPCSLYRILNINDLVQQPNSYRYSTDLDVCRGYLKEEDVYNANNVLLKKHIINYNLPVATGLTSPNYTQLLSKAVYFYTICDSTCSKCYEGAISFNPYTPSWGDGDLCSDYTLNNITVADDWIICPWIYKTNENDTVYDMNGLNPVVSTTAYYYDNPVHALVTRIITTNSKGDTLETLNKYAGDQAEISGLSTTASSALSSLVSMNKIAAPIEIDHFNSGTLMDLTRTDYQVWNTSPMIVEPQHVWYETRSNQLEDRLDYYQYDGNSNLQEVAKSNDSHHSFIWDYHVQLPIAEVTGAVQSDIAYTSFEADGTGNWTIPDTIRNRAVALTGNISYGLSNGSISKTGLNSATNYIVSYWLLNNSGSVSVSGGAATSNASFNGWTYYEVPVSGASAVTVSGTGTIDELRLYPKGAQMSTYTYSPLIGMTTHCDPSGHLTFYTYDGLGRLHLIKDQYGNILKRYDYEYQSANQ